MSARKPSHQFCPSHREFESEPYPSERRPGNTCRVAARVAVSPVGRCCPQVSPNRHAILTRAGLIRPNPAATGRRAGISRVPVRVWAAFLPPRATVRVTIVAVSPAGGGGAGEGFEDEPDAAAKVVDALVETLEVQKVAAE